MAKADTATKTKKEIKSDTADIEAKEAAKESAPAPAKAEDLDLSSKEMQAAIKKVAKNLDAVETAPAPAKTEEKKEETAVSMSTDAFSKEILTEFQKRSKAIKTAIGKIDSSFETIAFNLHWINVKQAYKAEGFGTITDYAADTFGYQKTTCYSLISVVDRFAKRDEKGAIMETFDDRVKGYSVSKLSLMVNLTDAEINSLKPTMTVRDIKAFVKSLEGKALPPLSEGEGEPEEEETGNEENIVDSTATVISNTLIKISGKAEYDKKADRFDEYIQRVFKKHPDAVIEISYSLPAKEGEKA